MTRQQLKQGRVRDPGAGRQVHFHTIQERTGRKCYRTFCQGEERRLSVWGAIPDAPGKWQWPDGANHTLCLNLEGGEWLERQIAPGKPAVRGKAGYSTLHPQGCGSVWTSSHMNDRYRALHFYFTQADLSRYAIEVLDIEPLSLELNDVVFDHNEAIRNIASTCILPLDWSEKSDRVALTSAIQLLLFQIIRKYVDSSRFVKASHKGGLSLIVQKRIAEYIDAHLDETMTIENLADVAGLSAFHFARMFHQSFGMTPHNYLKEKKIDLAKSLLSDPDIPLIDIAVASGYCSPSHFSRQFKSVTRLTPSQYRALNSNGVVRRKRQAVG